MGEDAGAAEASSATSQCEAALMFHWRYGALSNPAAEWAIPSGGEMGGLGGSFLAPTGRPGLGRSDSLVLRPEM